MTAPIDEKVLLRGFGLGGYRSLRDLQSLGPLRKVTLVAGQNNSGKSNILRFAASMLSKQVPALEWVDEPQPPGPPLLLQVAYRPVDVEGLKRMAPRLGEPHRLVALLEHEVFHPVVGHEVWLTYATGAANRSSRSATTSWALDDAFLNDVMVAVNAERPVLSKASSELTSTSGGGENQDLRRVLDTLFPFDPPSVKVVGAFRQISSGGAPTDEPASRAASTALPEDYSGRNLIQRLAGLEAPPAQRYLIDRAKFEAINQFARTVLEDSDVAIRIPAAQDEIQVHQGGRVLPLASLGPEFTRS